MKIKKLISILLGACFPLACFAGCGGNGASGGDGGEDGMNGGGTNEGEYLSYNEDVLNVEWLGMLTGPESANRTDMEYVVGGTDLGIPVYNSKNDTMYLFFGDTFQNEKNQTGYWRSNVVGLSKDYDLSDGLTFDSFLAGSSGIAKAVIDGHHADGFEMTKIPTGAVEVDGVLYMFYFSIRTWNPNSMNYGGAVKSTDNGETWERVYDMTWVDHDEGGYSADIARLVNEDIDLQENGGNIDIAGRAGNTFTQIFPIDGKDGYIYILGEGKYRQGGIRMGRVKKENIEVFEEYEYFNGIENGQPVWLKGSEGLAVIEESKKSYIIADHCSEQSCMYNEYLQKWMVVYLHNNGDGIVYREADNIYGPYSEPKLLVPYSYPFANGVSSIYGGFVHEKYTEQNGKVFYMTISQWMPVYNSSLVKITLK